jgi:P27 family predicted phage terminase small subunit
MPPRGPKPKPTHLKLVTGNPGKHRLPKNEPMPDLALPPVPHELCDDAKVEWERVSLELYKLGLLSNIDRASLAAYCAAYGRWIKAERVLRKMEANDPVMLGLLSPTKSKNIIQNPMVGVANKAMADMMRYAVEFGMTPSARARINAGEPGDRTEGSAASFVR